MKSPGEISICVTPGEAAAHDLIPARIAVDAQGLGMVVRRFSDPATYLHLAGPPGGPLGLRIEVYTDLASDVESLEELVKRRYAKWRDFVEERHLVQMAAVSGGDIRDFFRLIRECLVVLGSTGQVKTSDEIVQQVIRQLKNDMLPIADADAIWLLEIHETKDPALKDTTELPRLARFFDHNLIMNYQNGGEPWYDVHPIVVDEIERHGRTPPLEP